MYEEKNNNSHQTNQVLLSVLAVAILVVAVVGVSFAFFIYSRQGTTTNIINTGSLVFKYNEGEAGIKLENALPVADPKDGTAGTDDYFDFKVISAISGDMNIDYEISIRDVTITDAKKTEREHLDPKYVKVALYKSESEGSFASAPVKMDYFSKLQPSTENDGAMTLATGTFMGTTTDTQTHYYRFKMWFAKLDADNKETMMAPDMCTNVDYKGGSEKIPCDDPVYGEDGSNSNKGTFDTKNYEGKGTNGKTFAVKLDVTAKDATA